MDEYTKNVLSWKPYVWRGAIGGAIGSIVVLLVYTTYVWFSVDAHFRAYLERPFLLAGVIEILAAVIIGLVIGFCIFALTRRSGKQPSIALRVAGSAGCILAFLLLRDLTHNGPSHPLFDLGYAAAVGGLAGLMAHATMDPASASRDSRA
jgi:uncharacterized membrane protein YeaQ/YmgE (transglycosylase-associated protein family)